MELDLNGLSNCYYGLRHGESKANVMGIIISDGINGRDDQYGLSDNGILQVTNTAQLFYNEMVNNNNNDQHLLRMKSSELMESMVIYASNFSRAVQTAQIFKSTLLKLIKQGSFLCIWLMDNVQYIYQDCKAMEHLFEKELKGHPMYERMERNHHVHQEHPKHLYPFLS